MRATITIDMDNAAFQPTNPDDALKSQYQQVELRRILLDLCDKMAVNDFIGQAEHVEGYVNVPMIDINGNRVGVFTTSDTEIN